MPRLTPKAPPAVPSRQTTQPEVVEERTYTLITPLFGGGTTPKRADAISRVRIPSIRGQLRFWWRATRGLGTLTAMRAREGELWGAASTGKEGNPSQIQLELLRASKGTEERPFQLKGREAAATFPGIESPHYAAFPLQPTTQELKTLADPKQGQTEQTPFAPVLKGISFTLRLRYPQSIQAEVDATLWAWETFGGVGGRTRRGFGALRVDSVIHNGKSIPVASLRPPAGSFAEMDAWMQQMRTRHVLEGERGIGFPFISKNKTFWRFFTPSEVKSGWPRVLLKLGQIQKDEKDALNRLPPGPTVAWHFLIQQLRRFRQDRPKFPYENNTWPEADAVRTLTGESFAKHAPQVRGVPRLNVFPRAALGLPIVLHFKDGPDKTGRGKSGGKSGDSDPADHSILGETRDGVAYDRLASPVILRPLVCADGQCGAVALRLQGSASLPVPLMLRRDADAKVVATGLRQTPEAQEAAQIPMLKQFDEANTSSGHSAARAFLNYLRPSPNPSKKG